MDSVYRRKQEGGSLSWLDIDWQGELRKHSHQVPIPFLPPPAPRFLFHMMWSLCNTTVLPLDECDMLQ